MLNIGGLHMIAVPRNGGVSRDFSLVRLCFAFCGVTALYLVCVGVLALYHCYKTSG